ncbi:AMP-binding protein [Catenulispora rubra]|uniref:AMP-binding protein n=1 Tax=Catenulispora rubra TaxID=280293 RepID=UPI0018927680|nr:AMP-binding protein [Catenulispora rubra]
MYATQHAAEHPDQAALIMSPSGEVVTYRSYEQRANQIAHLLRRLGLRRGDHIAVLDRNTPAMLLVEAAAGRTGLYYTLVNAHLNPDEMTYIVDNCQAKAFFAGASLSQVAQVVAERCPRLGHKVVIGIDPADPAPSGGWESLDALVAGLPTTPIDDEQLGATMHYSSGTTGRPKGILRPPPEMSPVDSLTTVAFRQQLFGFRKGMTYLNPAPLYHSAPEVAVSTALRTGGTVVVMEHFEPEQWLALVERHRVTHCYLVPTMFHRLLALPVEVRSRYDVSSLESVFHSAAPCPAPVKRAMIEWLGPIVNESYAATEAYGFTHCTSREWLAHPGTVGRAVRGEIVIRDEAGHECPAGVDGTIWFRGATNFEYFGDPDKTRASRDEDGRTSTVGDVGHVDEGGRLYLTDRKSYLIITGGVNVYPAEAENLLATHPAVADVAVIGVPHEDMGEEVKAVVQVAPGRVPDPALADELIAFCRERLAHFKCPRSVDFVDELPRLATGKLYKRALRDRYWEGHATPIG